ncbi:ABC transporter permease [Pseudoroseomonas aestuarii]|uniref:ABC transporter permease n=2 Tax=Teichococcus aestuarii TaxID=568898 RepID=A0A2U1V8Q3_9PROT|nr:ABC transporter permease [Pseudoroseomonas aestuarii]
MSTTTAGLPLAPQPVASPGYWQGVWKRLRRDPVTLACGGILLLMLFAILAAPLLAPADPFQTSMLRRLRPVGTPNYILGSDELGRDMLTRLLYGGRLSWFIGITPVVIAFGVGGLLGIVAGFAGGWVNMLIMRVTDVFYAFPSVLLAVAISGALGAGVFNAILSLTLVFIPQIIRVAESTTTSVRNLDYVEAARGSGAGAMSIVRVHILPNVLGPIFVYATSLISVSMIIASGLSFLGLGTKPPEAEWGLMLNTLRSAIYSQPLLAMLPGLCIFVTSMCFNLVSDGLRAAMDVRN